MEAQIAVAKVGKYATPESGDSLEMIERPSGGLSFVLADGQSSGKSAKAISNVVTRKAISLLAEGVRDGAAARAASDYLFTYRAGKVLATLNILSIDLYTRTLVLTRNNPAPAMLIQNGQLQVITEPAEVVGVKRGTRPQITEVPLEAGLAAIVFTDGLTHAGERHGQPLDLGGFVEALVASDPVDPQSWADRLVSEAVERDQGRPCDDISVLVAAIYLEQADDRRRLLVSMAF